MYKFFFGGVQFIYLFTYLCMYVCMYIWLRWVFVAARGLSLTVSSGGYSWLESGVGGSPAVHGLLIAVASLAVEHRL